jgi:pimeloyl-ACP methyl ester carboxylesterase
VAFFTHATGKYLQIEDSQIYFETAGNPDGQPLVLLHGGLGTMADFNSILEKLPQQFRFIGIDLRGQGKSTTGAVRLSYEQYQEDVEAVLVHLGVDSCCLLGFSDGGIVGYRLAAKEQTKIKKLITIGSQWRLKADDPSFSMLSGVTSKIWSGMFPESVKYYEKINQKPDFDALVKSVVQVWTDSQSTGYPDEAVRNIKAPMLIVRGDEDPLFSLSEAVELRSRVRGSSFLNIPFAGHVAYEESGTIFLAAANAFLIHS